MPKFSTQVALMGPDYRPVSFAPGDEVPEWALDSVGAHVLEPEEDGPAEESAETPDFTGASETVADEAEDEGEGEGEDAQDETPAETPDFTAPAPPRRRTRKA